MFSFHRSNHFSHFVSITLVGISLVACTGAEGEDTVRTETTSAVSSKLSGTIAVDGSSTVFPITEAMAQEFQLTNNGVKITVDISGTGGGFKKFCAGETDISNASRLIKDQEKELCKAKGIEFIELPIGFDALSVVVNRKNYWAKCLSVEELQKIWGPAAEGKIKNWSQVRDGFPSTPIVLFGPGQDSGTLDYFTKAVNGTEGATRSDFEDSEDDNTLAAGIQQTKGAFGYFGYAYFTKHRDKLNAVEIDRGNGCIPPNPETVLAGTYNPLARLIFIYVKKTAMDRPEVKAFVEFYMNKEKENLVTAVGNIPLPNDMYGKAQKRLSDRVTGSNVDALF